MQSQHWVNKKGKEKVQCVLKRGNGAFCQKKYVGVWCALMEGVLLLQ